MHRTRIVGMMALALGGLRALAACSGKGDNGVMCPDNYAYGIVLSVEDAATGADAVAGATGIAVDGAYRDSVSIPGGTSPHVPAIQLAGERAGTYAVTVRKPGYADWSNSNVVVTRDVCHVHPVMLTARLQPAP